MIIYKERVNKQKEINELSSAQGKEQSNTI